MSKEFPVMDHPRIFFLKSDLKWIRRIGFEAKDFLNEKEMKLTYMGGKEITFALPPVEPCKIEEPPGFDHKGFGHYPYWTGMAGNIRGRMEQLALSFASTVNPSYADTAISYALSLADWSIWTDLQYHPDGSTCLDTCSLVFGVSTVYDICYERMTPEQRGKVRRGLISLGLEPLYRDCVKAFTDDRAWMRAWNLPLYQHSALGIGALAVMGDVPEEDFSRWFSQAKDYFTWFLEQQMISPDTEGMSYDSFSMDYAMIFADAFKRVTGNDELFRHPYVRDFLPKRAIYLYGPNDSGCVNFGDCGRENGGGQPFVTSMKIIAKHTGNGYAGWYLEATRPRVPPVSRNGLDFYAVPKPPVTSPSSLPTSKVFQNIGWVALRSGFEDDGTLFAFKCSSSQAGHDHWDQNNFVINCAGEWLATDAGYGSFRSAEDNFYGKHTIGHNTVLVDGGP
jgi:hypothetical protein